MNEQETEQAQEYERDYDAEIKDSKLETRLLRHGAWAGELAASTITSKT